MEKSSLMKYFDIDLTQIPKVLLLGKEALIPPRMHVARLTEEFILYAVTDGELQLEVNGRAETLLAGDIRLFAPGTAQRPVKSSYCTYYYLHVAPDITVEKEGSADSLLPSVRQKHAVFQTASIFDTDCYRAFTVFVPSFLHITDRGTWGYLIDLLERNKTALAPRTLEHRLALSHEIANLFLKLEELAVQGLRKEERGTRGSTYRLAMKIARYIEENYPSPITGDDIEKNFFISFDYANRILGTLLHQSIIQYRNRLRIDAAKSYLRLSDMSLQEITERIGFEGESYFCRIFKKYEGLTPTQYRNVFTEKNEVY